MVLMLHGRELRQVRIRLPLHRMAISWLMDAELAERVLMRGMTEARLYRARLSAKRRAASVTFTSQCHKLCHRWFRFALHLPHDARLVVVDFLGDQLSRCCVKRIEGGHRDTNRVAERLDACKFAFVDA